MERRALRILALAGLVLSGATSVFADDTAHLWSQRFGDGNNQEPNAVAVDAAGNVIVAGGFAGAVNFGGANLVSAGSNDIFVAKFDAAGVHLWSQRFGDGTNQTAYSVAADTSGNIIIAGGFAGVVNFGGGNLGSAGGDDIFVAKFDAAGVHQWSKRFGSSVTQIAYSVTADASDNVILTGAFSGTVNFGGANLSSAIGFDIFLAKFDAAGLHQWSKRFGDSQQQIARSVAADPDGNVVIAGYYAGTVNFGGSDLTVVDFSNDAFVAKFDATGVHQWSRGFGIDGEQFGWSVDADPSGNTIVTGNFTGSVDFGGGVLAGVGSEDAFVAAFDPAGTHLWSRRFGDLGQQNGRSVVTDALCNVLVTGFFTGTVNLGGADLVSAGGFDVFVARFNPAGVHLWSQRFGDASSQGGYGAATDAVGNVAVTGYVQGAVNFGGTNLTSNGLSDVFLVKFGAELAAPVIVDVLDVGGDQGRQVTIRFEASGFDDPASTTVVEAYEAYLREDPLPLLPASGDDRGVWASASRAALAALGWIFVGEIAADGSNAYDLVATTLADSTVASGPHSSVFFLRASTTVPSRYYDSAPDSGYSLDNLAPVAPGGVAYGAPDVSWDPPTDDDFDYFSVYGSNSAAFGSATFIDYTTATAMDVTASPFDYYFVTATDFSGNEGNAGMTGTATAVRTGPVLLSLAAYPNPFNPRTTLRYVLPASGRVTIAIYDASGRHVATLVDAQTPAGDHTVTWNGRTGGGTAAGSGIYFARLHAGDALRSCKLVLLK